MTAELFETLKNELLKSMEEKHQITNANIESLKTALTNDVEKLRSDVKLHDDRLITVESALKSDKHNNKIEELELEVEILKQDRLRNGIRLTGLPQVSYNDPDDAILRIAETLQIDVIPSDYMAYVDRNNTSIILSFNAYTMKRYFMDAMRSKKSLFVEELCDGTKSNARIYANDQLSPYFAKIFKRAWESKKEGKIHSVSSLGGRIRVQKGNGSSSVTVMTLTQLEGIIVSECPSPPQTNPSNTENQNIHTTESQKSQNESISQHASTSPQSIDSGTARTIREKPFSNNRSSFTRPTTSSSGQQQKKNQHQQQSDRRTNPKRNNRHISTRETRSHQPTQKKGKFNGTNRPHPASDQDMLDYEAYRQWYQDRLRSFTRK